MTRNRYYDGPPSNHFDGVRFFNPGEPNTDRSLWQVLRWKLVGGAAKWPANIPTTPVTPDARVNGLRITMVGHATVLIQVAGLNILTDPVWSERASPFRFAGPRRATQPGIAFDDLPPIDAVLISHCHYDHLDVATLKRLQAVHAPLMAMPLGNDAIIRRAVPGARCVVGSDCWIVAAQGRGAQIHFPQQLATSRPPGHSLLPFAYSREGRRPTQRGERGRGERRTWPATLLGCFQRPTGQRGDQRRPSSVRSQIAF